jgi:hypothetical protein
MEESHPMVESDILFDALVDKLASISFEGRLLQLPLERLATIFIAAVLAIPAIQSASAESKNEIAAGICSALARRLAAADAKWVN